MKLLTVPREVMQSLYARVELLTPHADLYFIYHVEPVARNCLMYAERFRQAGCFVDPVICQLGGLFHDIGYTKEYEVEEKDHIDRGIVITSNILDEYAIGGVYKDKILDCILTHDGNLSRSRYSCNNLIPLENVIVNDVDALCFFDWPFDKLIEFARDRLKAPSLRESLRQEAEKTLSYIHNPLFETFATVEHKVFMEKLQKWN